MKITFLFWQNSLSVKFMEQMFDFLLICCSSSEIASNRRCCVGVLFLFADFRWIRVSLDWNNKQSLQYTVQPCHLCMVENTRSNWIRSWNHKSVKIYGAIIIIDGLSAIHRYFFCRLIRQTLILNGQKFPFLAKVCLFQRTCYQFFRSSKSRFQIPAFERFLLLLLIYQRYSSV